MLSIWEMLEGVTPTSLASSVWEKPLLVRSSLRRMPSSMRPVLLRSESNVTGEVLCPVVEGGVEVVGVSFFGFQNAQGRFSPFEGQIDGDLGDLVDLSPELGGVGAFFDDPVGDRVQFVETGTGMGVEVEDVLFAGPQFLHAGEAFEHEPDVAFEFGMYAVEGVHGLFDAHGLLDRDDAAAPRISFGVLVEFQEHVGPFAFAVGEAIQNGQHGVFGQRSQSIQEVLGAPVEADIDQGLVLRPGSLDEVEAEDQRETSGVVVPHDVVADEKSPQQPVEFADSGGNANSV